MAIRSELQSLESECASVDEWLNLAKQALTDPEDTEYAQELAGKAEMDCQEPAEYVSLATFMVSQFNDNQYAEELLEQAEDACFEAMEFAAVGHAYATLMNNADKGLGLIRNSVDDASGTDLIVLADYAGKAGDAELATSLISRVTSDLKEVSQFQELAQKLVKSGNVEEAKTVFRAAERHLDTVADTVKYAESVLKLFDDQDQARSLLENAEIDCQFPADYTALASGFREIMNDEEKVGELLQEAADSAMEGEEFLDVAYGFWQLRQDRESAREYFEQALPDLSDRVVLLKVASAVATELEDLGLARQFYEKTAERITNASDLVKLAAEVWEKLGDREYTMKLFRQAEEKMGNANDLVSLAESVMNTLNDGSVVQAIYTKASASIDSFSGLKRILESQRETINDAGVAFEILSRMKNLADSTSEHIEIFDSSQANIDNAEFSESALAAAEEAAASPADLESVIKAVKEFASDNIEWQTNLDDKLQRRRANQAKYAEYQKQEKQISTALEFIRLARTVVQELDDLAYARKLIDRAKELLETENFDVSQWEMLINFAANELNDHDLVREVATDASSACELFSSVYQLARKMRELPNKALGLEFTGEILKEWFSKMYDSAGRIKCMKAVVELLQDRNWVESFLTECEAKDFNMLQLAELGLIADQVDNPSKAQEFYTAALEKCSSAAEISQLNSRLKSSGTDEEHRKQLYLAGKNSLANAPERLHWIEGILLNFGDYSWAKNEYDDLQPDVSGEAMQAAFTASRRQRLERRI